MLNLQIDPTFLHIYAKIQPTATSTAHIIDKCLPETNMPTKLGMYVKYLMCIYGGYMCICGHIRGMSIKNYPVHSGTDTRRRQIVIVMSAPYRVPTYCIRDGLRVCAKF